MLTHLLMIVLFAVFAGLPLFYAWRVFRLDEAARGGWLVRVAEAALLLLLFLALRPPVLHIALRLRILRVDVVPFGIIDAGLLRRCRSCE